MIVCHCRGITDRDIRGAGEAGTRQVLEATRCGNCCGGCSETIRRLLSQNAEPLHHSERSE